MQKSNELTRNTLANKLIHKQQRPDQSQYGMLEAFMTNFILKIICRIEAMLTDTAAFAENL